MPFSVHLVSKHRYDNLKHWPLSAVANGCTSTIFLITLYYKMQAHSWCEDHTTPKNLIGMVLIHWRCKYRSNFVRCFTCSFEHFMISFLWAQTTGNHMLTVIHTAPRTWISAWIMKCDTCSEVGNIWPEETAVMSAQKEHNCCLHQITKK